jgi:hypothetical protein
VIVTRVKHNGRRVRLAGFGPQKYQMFALAQAGVKSIKARVMGGIGSDDAPMKPLKVMQKGSRFSKSQGKVVEFDYGNAYAAAKRRAGLKPIRDLVGFGRDGHMLDDFRVTYADPRLAKADITRAPSRVKARGNEARSPWWGFSGRDVRNLVEASKKIFGEVLDGIRLGLQAGNRRAPIWMDPVGIGLNAGAGDLPIVSRVPSRVASAARKVASFKAGVGKRGRRWGAAA